MSDKCKDYPIETNFTLIKDYRFRPPFSIDTTIPYYCNMGYVSGKPMFVNDIASPQALLVMKEQTPVFTCKLVNDSAVWIMDTECKPISCGDAGFVENATRRGTVFTFSETVTFTCHDGYKMKGNFFQRKKSRFCDVNGNWTPPLDEIECESDSCSYLDPPAGGFIAYTNDQFIGSEAQYSCKEGYLLSGNPTRKCSDNAIWTGSAPECKIICPSPDPMPNGTINLERDIYTLHDIITYYCPSTGQYLTSKCQENGKWSSPPPLCEIKEPSEDLPKKKRQKASKQPTKAKKKKERIKRKFFSYFIYSILILLIAILFYKSYARK